MWMKKSRTLSERIDAVEKRMAEIKGDLPLREKHVGEKKEEIGSILASLALDPDNQENKSSLFRAKKALGIQTEHLDDLKTQLTFLREERKRLDLELWQAKLRDIPAQAEQAAGEFNTTLAECLASMEILRGLHEKLKTAEIVFLDLCKEHQSSASKLGIMQSLDLTIGLGSLAKQPGPHGYSFQVPPFALFVSNLLDYAAKIKNYEEFKTNNPSYEKDVAAQRTKDGSFAWDSMIAPRYRS